MLNPIKTTNLKSNVYRKFETTKSYFDIILTRKYPQATLINAVELLAILFCFILLRSTCLLLRFGWTNFLLLLCLKLTQLSSPSSSYFHSNVALSKLITCICVTLHGTLFRIMIAKLNNAINCVLFLFHYNKI